MSAKESCLYWSDLLIIKIK